MEYVGESAESFTGNTVNYPIVVFSIIIFIAGLLGNILVVFVVLILKEYKKSVTHWYVLQLAIADSIFLLTLPFNINEDLNGRWIYPEWMCKAKEAILFINYYASILFLMIMSLDRYIAVCHSFSNIMQRFRAQRTAIIIAITAWIISIALSTPIMVYAVKSGTYPTCTCSYEFPRPVVNKTENCLRNVQNLTKCLALENTFLEVDNGEVYCRVLVLNQDLLNKPSSLDAGPAVDDIFVSPTTMSDAWNSSHYDDKKSSENSRYKNRMPNGISPACTYKMHPNGWIIFLAFNFSVMFLLPFFVMVACYGLIIYKLSRARKFTSNLSSSPNSLNTSTGRNRKSSARSETYRRRVTIMCAALVIAFVVCWLPFHAVHLAKIAGIRVSPEHESMCTVLPAVGSLLAYLNSALNPYLYSLLGTNFTRRWHETTSTIHRSIKKKKSSSSFGSVRFTKKRFTGDTESKAHNTGTVITKIYRNSHKKAPPFSEAGRSVVGNNMTKHQSEVQHLNAVTQVPTDNIEKENSLLDASKELATS